MPRVITIDGRGNVSNLKKHESATLLKGQLKLEISRHIDPKVEKIKGVKSSKVKIHFLAGEQNQINRLVIINQSFNPDRLLVDIECNSPLKLYKIRLLSLTLMSISQECLTNLNELVISPNCKIDEHAPHFLKPHLSLFHEDPLAFKIFNISEKTKCTILKDWPLGMLFVYCDSVSTALQLKKSYYLLVDFNDFKDDSGKQAAEVSHPQSLLFLERYLHDMANHGFDDGDENLLVSNKLSAAVL